MEKTVNSSDSQTPDFNSSSAIVFSAQEETIPSGAKELTDADIYEQTLNLCSLNQFAVAEAAFAKRKNYGSKNAWEYLLALMLKYQCSQPEELAAISTPLPEISAWKTVLKYADADLLEQMHQIADKQKSLKIEPEKIQQPPPIINQKTDEAETKQELDRLQWLVEQKRNTIASLPSYLGQAFAEHRKEFEDNLTRGNQLSGDEESQAHACFSAALTAAEWLENNLPLCKQALELQERLSACKSESDRLESEKLSGQLYRQAADHAKAGADVFQNGNFVQAIANFQTAADFYKQATSEAKQIKIQSLLDACRTAEQLGNWQQLQKLVEELRSLDLQKASELSGLLDNHLVVPLGNDINLELVKITAGSFTMSKKDGENSCNEVEHTAVLTKDFYLGKYPVTQAQYQAVMGSNPSEFKGDSLPVENVSWYDAVKFCKKLNENKEPFIASIGLYGSHFSLPTETQWEYAAGGEKKSQGFKYSGSNLLDEVGWYEGNSEQKTHKIGTKAPNELGLYDMSGNIAEWCLDVGSCCNKNLPIPEFKTHFWLIRPNFFVFAIIGAVLGTVLNAFVFKLPNSLAFAAGIAENIFYGFLVAFILSFHANYGQVTKSLLLVIVSVVLDIILFTVLYAISCHVQSASPRAWLRAIGVMILWLWPTIGLIITRILHIDLDFGCIFEGWFFGMMFFVGAAWISVKIGINICGLIPGALSGLLLCAILNKISRTIRGGFYNGIDGTCRITTRFGQEPRVRRNNVGFRIALVRD